MATTRFSPPCTRRSPLSPRFALASAARAVVLCDRRRRRRAAKRHGLRHGRKPARELAGGLLTWASPDRVYATYVQVFALLFPAVLLCALRRRALSDRRRPAGSSAGAGASLFAGYPDRGRGLDRRLRRARWADRSAGESARTCFFPRAAGAGDAARASTGSTLLGVALLRDSYAPRLTAWLLALAVPLMLVGSDVLGHNSLGIRPLFLAWAATGRHLWQLERSTSKQPAL